jgi:hypothetical protein
MPAERPTTLHRPLRSTIRRHRLVLLATLCLLSSLLYLLAPTLQRSYHLAGTVQITPRLYEPIPDLARLPAAVVKHLEGEARQQGLQLTLSQDRPPAYTLHLASAAPSRDTAYVRLQGFVDGLALLLRHQAEETADNYRLSLEKQQARLADQEQGLAHDLSVFDTLHPPTRAGDPGTPENQLQNAARRLDEKQERLRLVTNQITRLEEYKKVNQNRPAAAALPPPAPLPPVQADAPANPPKPEDDPEVVALTAQLQLIDGQIEEQLKTRTEQHPYVVDLRTQQVALQRKMEMARQRAAAGKPAPPVTSPLAPRAAAAPDPTLAPNGVDVQLENLQAERDTLETDIQILQKRTEELQKVVKQGGTADRDREAITGQLAAVKKDREATQAALKEFDRQFAPAASQPGAALTLDVPLMDVSRLALQSASTLPTFPRLPVIYGAGLLAGLAAAAAVATLLHRGDRSLHSAHEAAALLDVPVLGVVSEIRGPGQVARGRLLKTVRPALSLGLLLLMAATALLCYRRLADPNFPQTRGLSGAFSVGDLASTPLTSDLLRKESAP